MKITSKFFLACILSLSLLSVCYADEVKSVLVQLVQPTSVEEKSQNTSSVLAELNETATQWGLDKVTIIGTNSYETLPNKNVRVVTTWHTLADANDKRVPIPTPLVSKVQTDQSKIEVGTQLEASGNIQSLLDALQALRNKDAEGESIDKGEEKQDNDKAQVSPASSGSSSGDDWSNSGSGSDMTTEMITKSYEDCPPRVDMASGAVFMQAKEIVKQGSEVTSDGRCVDTGTTIPLQKEQCGTEADINSLQLYKKYEYSYFDQGTQVKVTGCLVDKSDFSSIPTSKKYGGNCGVEIDHSKMKVYRKFSTVAYVDGVEVEVDSCTTDYDSSFDLIETSDGCSVRHDFDNKKSYMQTRLYYQNKDGEIVNVQTCQDSSSTGYSFAQYQTANTCNYYYDSKNGKAFKQERTAYMVDGKEYYASDCSPVGEGFAVESEVCSPKYDHDLSTGQSYLITKKFYNDADGTKVYVTNCERSTETSFPISYETEGCDQQYNDDTKYMTWVKSAFITDNGERININSCVPVGTPEPYTYSGTENVTKEFTDDTNDVKTNWIVPDGVETVYLNLVGAGSAGGAASPPPVDSWVQTSYEPVCKTTGATGKFGEILNMYQNVVPGESIAIRYGTSNTEFKDLVALAGKNAIGGYKGYGEPSTGQICTWKGDFKIETPYRYWRCYNDPAEKISCTGPSAPKYGYLGITYGLKVYIRPDGTTYVQGK